VNANLFALLDDDDDDQAPAQKAPAQKKAQPKAEEPKAKPAGKGNAQRNNRGKGEPRDESTYDGGDKPQKPGDNESRKGGKGSRRRDDSGKGKGKGGPREYDRRSQDGRKGGKGGEAREGRGKYNWGEKTDYKPTEGAEGAAPAEGAEAPAVEAEPEPVEEEEVTMSLDEYMAAQNSKLAALPQLKAERKVDNSAGGIEFSRDQGGKEDEELGMIFKSYDGKRTKGDGKAEREGWVNADNVMNLKFADNSSSDRDDRPSKGKGKGERREGGKGKGDGGRGPKKASRPSGPGFSQALDDNSAFPTLG